MKPSITWFALCMATAFALTGCASLRQGESTSRCTDCATALFRDTGSGGSIYNVASASQDAVGRVARRYCSEHKLGQPAIGNRYASSALGNGFWGYDFSCGPRETTQVQQPVGGDVGGSADKGDQNSSNGVAGEWRVVRTYPDRPGSQGSHTEFFQLVCKGESSEELKFPISVSADGDVFVAVTKVLTESGQTEARAYVNAIRWQDGEDIYVVNRFTGALTVEPGKRSYQCEKVGGRKF
jgi:hypothetical protein